MMLIEHQRVDQCKVARLIEQRTWVVLQPEVSVPDDDAVQRDTVLTRVHETERHVVLDASSVSDIDASADAITDAITDDMTDGITRGITSGITDGITNGITDGITDDITDGITCGIANSITDFTYLYRIFKDGVLQEFLLKGVVEFKL